MKRTNRWRFAAYIGLYAGLIWGGCRLLFYYLGFTKIVMGFLIEPFMKHDFLVSWGGQLLGWLVFIAFSLAATFVYMLFFMKRIGAWPGMIYGIAWWIAFYLGIGSWAGMLPPIRKLSWDTMTSEFCLFLLWGLFIGFSIAFEFNEEQAREPKTSIGS